MNTRAFSIGNAQKDSAECLPNADEAPATRQAGSLSYREPKTHLSRAPSRVRLSYRASIILLCCRLAHSFCFQSPFVESYSLPLFSKAPSPLIASAQLSVFCCRRSVHLPGWIVPDPFEGADYEIWKECRRLIGALLFINSGTHCAFVLLHPLTTGPRDFLVNAAGAL